MAEENRNQLPRSDRENGWHWVRIALARARRREPVARRVRRFLGTMLEALRATTRMWDIKSNPRLYSVLIETCSMCNRKCKFCPVACYPRPRRLMPRGLYTKVIDELQEAGFAGRIGLHSYNEPLLDRRLPRLISYAREQLPGATIMLSTNGDLLTMGRWQELRQAGLDYAWVSQYDGRINDNVANIMKSLPPQERKEFRVSVFSAFTNTRAGLIEYMKQVQIPLRADCLRPSFQMVIAYDGKVPICCQDYLAREVMGDVNKESLTGIWKNEKFQNARRQLRRKDRSFSAVCSNCNASHMYPR